MSIDLVIFDCDGVLIDSEPIANRVFAHELESVGISMTPEEVMRTFIGRSRDTCIEMAGRMRGKPLPADFAATWDAALHEALENELEGRLFSAARVPRPKPAPDLFLHAAKAMGCAPPALLGIA